MRSSQIRRNVENPKELVHYECWLEHWICDQHVAGSTPGRRSDGERPWASRTRAQRL